MALGRRWCLAISLCATASGFQQPETGQRADVYAIYSLMMTSPRPSNGSDGNEIYLIADTTVPGYPREPCVRVPPAFQHDFDEVLADFNSRKDKPAKLERAFNISKPYELLNADQVKEFIDWRTPRRGPKPSPPELFRNSTGLFRLTDVYFNRRRTLALTAIAMYCGSLCGSMNWKVFEKVEGNRWEARPWVYCTTAS